MVPYGGKGNGGEREMINCVVAVDGGFKGFTV